MRSFIRLDFLANGVGIIALANPLVVNSLASEPDITDAFEVVVEAVSAAYEFFFGDKKKAAEEAISSSMMWSKVRM